MQMLSNQSSTTCSPDQIRKSIYSDIKSVVSQYQCKPQQGKQITVHYLSKINEALRVEVKQYKSLYQEQRIKYQAFMKMNQDLNQIGYKEKYDKLEKMLRDTHQKEKKQLEDQNRQKQIRYTTVQMQFNQQVSILKKKLQIVQRNRVLLQQQICILKQQLSSKQSKILYLNNEVQALQSMISLKVDTRMKLNQGEIGRMEIIVHQYRQSIEIHKQQLKILQQENKNLLSQNASLTSLLKSQKQMHEQTKQTSINEIQYYQIKLQKLQKNIKQLQVKVQYLQTSNIKSLEQSNQKWAKITEQFLKRVEILQKQINQGKKEKQYLQKSFNRHLLKYQTVKQQNERLIQENSWQKQLLQEAKGHIIASQLIKERTIQKVTQENREIIKRQQMYNISCSQKNFMKGYADSTNVSRNSSFYGNLSNKHSSVSLSPHTGNTNGIFNQKSQQFYRNQPSNQNLDNSNFRVNADSNENNKIKQPEIPIGLTNNKDKKHQLNSKQFFSKAMESITNNRNNSQITSIKDFSNNRKNVQYNTIKSIKSNRNIKNCTKAYIQNQTHEAFNRKKSAHYGQRQISMSPTQKVQRNMIALCKQDKEKTNQIQVSSHLNAKNCQVSQEEYVVDIKKSQLQNQKIKQSETQRIKSKLVRCHTPKINLNNSQLF